MIVQSPVVIGWRLRVLMAERDIRAGRALCRRLKEFGVSISEPQLGRIVAKLPRQLDTELLRGLCSVLNVGPGDLLVVSGAVRVLPPPTEGTSDSGSASASSALPNDSPSRGPRVTAFPKPKIP